MRHSQDELSELLNHDSPHFIEALGAGITSVAKLGNRSIFAPHKRSLYSHHVRSETFNYLEANPIEDYRVVRARHRQNQSVTLIHKSGLEIRYAKLLNISPITTPIPYIDEDPALSNALFERELRFQDPGIIALSWDRPELDDDGYPLDELEMIAVRAALGTTIRQGIADAIIPLTSQNQIIPDVAFDPNADDLTYKFEMDREEDGA